MWNEEWNKNNIKKDIINIKNIKRNRNNKKKQKMEE